MAGKLIIFSAPSGSGKSTIINYLLKQNLHLRFSISATSRAPRGTEKDGVEYYFLTPDEFRARIAAGDFLEYEEVYTDKFYGTLKSEVERILTEGDNVIFDVDVVGGCNIKNYYGKRALSLFIQPPSIWKTCFVPIHPAPQHQGVAPSFKHPRNRCSGSN